MRSRHRGLCRCCSLCRSLGRKVAAAWGVFLRCRGVVHVLCCRSLWCLRAHVGALTRCAVTTITPFAAVTAVTIAGAALAALFTCWRSRLYRYFVACQVKIGQRCQRRGVCKVQAGRSTESLLALGTAWRAVTAFTAATFATFTAWAAFVAWLAVACIAMTGGRWGGRFRLQRVVGVQCGVAVVAIAAFCVIAITPVAAIASVAAFYIATFRAAAFSVALLFALSPLAVAWCAVLAFCRAFIAAAAAFGRRGVGVALCIP